MLKEGILRDGFKIQMFRAESSEPDCLKLFRVLSNSIIFGTMWLCRKGEQHIHLPKRPGRTLIYIFKKNFSNIIFM